VAQADSQHDTGTRPRAAAHRERLEGTRRRGPPPPRSGAAPPGDRTVRPPPNEERWGGGGWGWGARGPPADDELPAGVRFAVAERELGPARPASRPPFDGRPPRSTAGRPAGIGGGAQRRLEGRFSRCIGRSGAAGLKRAGRARVVTPATPASRGLGRAEGERGRARAAGGAAARPARVAVAAPVLLWPRSRSAISTAGTLNAQPAPPFRASQEVFQRAEEGTA